MKKGSAAPSQGTAGIDISVIVVTYNRCDLLKECLDTIFRQTYPSRRIEVIVVDDGSKDNTLSFLQETAHKHPNVHCVIQAHQGPGVGRNLGLKSAQGKFIFFIDDDCWIEDNTLERLMHFARQHPQIAGFGLETIPIFPQAFFRPLRKFYYERILQHQRRFGAMAVLQSLGCRLSTDCCLIRTAIVEAVGGFDTKFTYAGEDPDFWFRVIKAGYCLAVVYEPLAYHHQRNSFWVQLQRHIKFGMADALNFKDHFPRGLCLEIIRWKWSFQPWPCLMVIRLSLMDFITLSGLAAFIHPLLTLFGLAAIFLSVYSRARSVSTTLSYLGFRYPMACMVKIGNWIGSLRYGVVVL